MNRPSFGHFNLILVKLTELSKGLAPRLRHQSPDEESGDGADRAVEQEQGVEAHGGDHGGRHLHTHKHRHIPGFRWRTEEASPDHLGHAGAEGAELGGEDLPYDGVRHGPDPRPVGGGSEQQGGDEAVLDPGAGPPKVHEDHHAG